MTPVQVRVAVLLIALLAVVVLPSEAMLVEQTGSVMDQVTSCLLPNGVARELDSRAAAGEHCRDDVPARPPIAILAVVFSLLAGLVPRSRSRWTGHGADRRRLPDAVFGGGAPWRAPPHLV